MKFLKDLTEHKNFKKTIIGIFCITFIFLTFSLGVFVGSEKARFSYRWRDNYNSNFGRPGFGMIPEPGMRPDFGRGMDFMRDDFVNPHGIAGSILKIEGNTISIKGSDNIEKTVVVNDNTTIVRKFKENIKITDIKADDSLVVIGNPNDLGQIEAKFIRILKKN